MDILSKNRYFITGIGTDVGKTLVAAIYVEKLKADYWKPIQCGSLEYSDRHFIEEFTSIKKNNIHNSTYNFITPCSPHLAAKIENTNINIENIKEPNFKKDIVIEGAGGIYVPLNDNDKIIDLIKSNYKVIVVSKNYLGSINHTLMSIDILKRFGKNILGIVFNGNIDLESEEIILKSTNIRMLGRIENEATISHEIIKKYSQKLEI